MSIYTERAEQAFRQEGLNCSQSVVYAFYPDRKDYITASSGFGGGFGRLREVCGAVSGAVFLLGLWYGYDDSGLPASFGEKNRKAALYKKVQEFAAAYKEENGSIICRELLGANPRNDNPAEVGARAPEFHKRPCNELVVCAVRILEKMMPTTL